MNLLLKTGYIYIHTFFFSPHGHQRLTRLTLRYLYNAITLFPGKYSLIFRAVNMTGKREDNPAIPFINLVKAHQCIWNYSCH